MLNKISCNMIIGDQRVQKIYGIDYNGYVCGGIGNQKIKQIGKNRKLFYTEKEMLEELANLKGRDTVGEIELFTTKIIKESYKI